MMLLLVTLTVLLSGWALSAPIDLAPDAPVIDQTSDSSPVVDLGYAKYRGQTLDSGVDEYLGIRYAAPPLGDLRWRAPAAPQQETDVQDATQRKPICLGTGQEYEEDSDSEDCLYVNVWAPQNTTADSRLPVWFYIQGGGYNANSNSGTNGTTVVSRSGMGVVVVTFNYRVGAYGFLASDTVQQDGDLNVGLLDQRMAMTWVKENVHKFGGDPDHVVIHGTSAGAGSVSIHLTAYGGRDDHLFVGAVAQAVFVPTQPEVPELEFQFSRFVSACNCTDAEDPMACLRSRDTPTLQAANIASPYPGQTTEPLWYFTPTIDGTLIQDHTYALFAQGKFIRVPTIWGDTTNEGTVFAANASSAAEVADFFTANYPLLSPADTDAINEEYPRMEPVLDHAAYFPSASAAYGESTFTCAGNTFSRDLQQSGDVPVWNYRFDVLTPQNVASGIGVPHTYDSSAIWGPGEYVQASTTNALGLMGYYISFVQHLSPNTGRFEGSPVWDEFLGEGDDGAQRRLLVANNVTRMESVPEGQVERCRFWERLAPTMEQ